MVNTNPYVITGLEPLAHYMVRIMARCSDDNYSSFNVISFYTLEDTTGIDDFISQTVLVYPNPTEGNVRIQSTKYEIQSMDVFDAYGKMVKNIVVKDNVAMIDMSNCASGLYFARITTSEGIVTKRFVKK